MPRRERARRSPGSSARFARFSHPRGAPAPRARLSIWRQPGAPVGVRAIVKVYHYGFGTKVKFSKSLCSVTVKRGRIVPGGWATSRVARRRSGPSSPKFASALNHCIVAHLKRRPAPRSGRSPHVRPCPPLFRPRRAKSDADARRARSPTHQVQFYLA